MIIYGSQMYGKKERVTTWGSCEHCGAYAKQHSYSARKWGHLYFIPLIPMGGHVRVLFECSQCSMGSHIPIEQLPAVTDSVREGLKPAVAASMAGEQTFVDPEGDELHTGAQLAGAVSMLYACNVGDVVPSLLEKLPDGPARSLVEGSEYQVTGNPDAAIDCYKRAAKASPEDVVPLLWLAELLANRGRREEARAVYEKAAEMQPDNVGIVANLADLCEAMKDWDGVCDHYETLFAAAPSLGEDKKLVKTYKKACKKSRRDPVAVQ